MKLLLVVQIEKNVHKIRLFFLQNDLGCAIMKKAGSTLVLHKNFLTSGRVTAAKGESKMELYEKNYELVFEEDFSGGLDQNKWVALDEKVKSHSAKKDNDFVPSHVITQGPPLGILALISA